MSTTSHNFIRGFHKIADDGSAMGRFATSALNAFGGPNKPRPATPPKPQPGPSDVSPGGQTMNNRMGNPFG